MNLTLSANNLCRSFSNRKVINDLSFTVGAPGSLGITGPNGSGKTTVMKMIAQLLPPSRGRVELNNEGQIIPSEMFNQYVKMVSPELALYEMLTGSENLHFFSRLADIRLTPAEVESELEQVGLGGRGTDLVATYSSGMKQRLKYAVALLSHPAVLLLDEPTSNLDEDGKSIVRAIIEEQRRKAILILATNESEELGNLDSVITLG